MNFIMKLLFIQIPALLTGLLLLIAVYVWQSGMMTRADFDYLVDYADKQGIAAVWDVISGEVFGYEDLETDPSYGRTLIDGRGHAPWVIRGNLDGKPRMLSFALAPNVWAAYETSTASLYQVWRGELLFQGASYDYRHGPQPESRGEWFVRNENAARWFVGATETTALPASVQYLGHKYTKEKTSASLMFALKHPLGEVQLEEYPELGSLDGELSFTRRFQRLDDAATMRVWVQYNDQLKVEIKSEHSIALAQSTRIAQSEFVRTVDVAEDQIAYGEQVIANSDCLSCHAAQHQVSGPSWSRIAGRYRGYVQEESLDALSDKVINGSRGAWGKQQMTPHPELSKTDALAAVAYILSQATPEISSNAPLDDKGNPYSASNGYETNPMLRDVHPSFALKKILPLGFEPKVGGMAFRSDGQLLVASWDIDGAVFLIDPDGNQAPRRIAEGLHEPLGLTVVNDEIYVLQKQELTHLIDSNGDEVIDEYRVVSQDWPSSSNFHSFAFGLEYHDGFFYALLSICVLPGGASCPDQLPTQGKLLKIALTDGKADVMASGFRTPNGIGTGEGKALFVTDNQGDWLPASKLVRIEDDGFYGSRAVPDENIHQREEIPPVVWLPQDEIGNSPSQPLLLTEGPYAGQLIFGDVTNGGIKRVFMEQVDGHYQGAAFHFSAGFISSVNRLTRGLNGDIFVGEVGNPPNWSTIGKQWHGVEKLSYTGEPAFEILSVHATQYGFTLTLTEPLADNIQLTSSDLTAKQWFYHPTEQYGGPKYDETVVVPSALELSQDRKQIKAHLTGLKEGYVVYMRLHPRLTSRKGQSMWVSEAWYTLNAIPSQL